MPQSSGVPQTEFLSIHSSNIYPCYVIGCPELDNFLGQHKVNSCQSKLKCDDGFVNSNFSHPKRHSKPETCKWKSYSARRLRLGVLWVRHFCSRRIFFVGFCSIRKRQFGRPAKSVYATKLSRHEIHSEDIFGRRESQPIRSSSPATHVFHVRHSLLADIIAHVITADVEASQLGLSISLEQTFFQKLHVNFIIIFTMK